MLEQYWTEAAVGVFFLTFSLAVKYWTASLSHTIGEAVRRIDLIIDRVQRIEVANAKQLATLEAHVTSIYKRLDREHPNGG